MHITDKGMTYAKMADAFNREFGTARNGQMISDHCLRVLHIHRGKENQYGFTAGKQTTRHTKPVGTEIESDGAIWVKVADEVVTDQRKMSKGINPNWMKKQHLVWERNYGKVPEGCLVVFLDKDYRNCAVENLYCTTRQINFMMAKNGWYSQEREITLTALKWCELYYALRKE